MVGAGWKKDVRLIGSFGCELPSVREWVRGPSAMVAIGQNGEARRNFSLHVDGWAANQ